MLKDLWERYGKLGGHGRSSYMCKGVAEEGKRYDKVQ